MNALPTRTAGAGGEGAEVLAAGHLDGDDGGALGACGVVRYHICDGAVVGVPEDEVVADKFVGRILVVIDGDVGAIDVVDAALFAGVGAAVLQDFIDACPPAIGGGLLP